MVHGVEYSVKEVLQVLHIWYACQYNKGDMLYLKIKQYNQEYKNKESWVVCRLFEAVNDYWHTAAESVKVSVMDKKRGIN